MTRIGPDPSMPLELRIVSEHADLVGDDAVREYHESGGTIGRALQNDWILPDPNRYVSSRHATIDYKGGIYYLADTSSNGVYVNDEVAPIGKGNPRRLFDGDRLRMGDFEMAVSIDSGESLVMPMPKEPSVAPDNIEQFVDEVSLRTGMKLLEEDEIIGDDAFQSVLFGSGPKKTTPEPEPEPEGEIEIETDAPGNDANPPSKDLTAEDLFDSFLDGLGINRVELHPSVDPAEMMLTAGQVLRAFVRGTSDMLASRAHLKNALRLDQAMVSPRHNNPMKFSENTSDLLQQLLIGGGDEYLGSQDAVREVCRDLINHQNAFLDAMNSAFIEFADRFDPAELQEGFDLRMGKKLFGFMRKMKYWRLYCDLYPVMTQKGTGRFPQMFAEEFINAYERRVTEHQRHNHDSTTANESRDMADQAIDSHLMETQKLERAPNTAETAFEEADGVDQSFIDELNNSMAEDVSQDQRKA